MDRFGFTVATERQWIWLDSPDSDNTWPLAASRCVPTPNKEVMMGKREDKTDQDRQDPPHKPQGTRTQPPDPDKPDAQHRKPDKKDDK